MKSLLVLMVTVMLGGVARAQTTAGGGAAPSAGYVEGIAQSAFGNVTSQSYGAEAGFAVTRSVQLFVEAGRIGDVSTSDLGVNAQTIAAALTLSQSGAVTYTSKEPVSFGVAGLKYLIPVGGNLEPYIIGGFGLARYTKDVRFLIGGTDATLSLAQYGVVLGRIFADNQGINVSRAGVGVGVRF
jgi:hypothetical protein